MTVFQPCHFKCPSLSAEVISMLKLIFNCQDEGVSLTATPGSSLDGCSSSVKASEPEFPTVSSPPPYPEPSEEVRLETPLLSRQETPRSSQGRDVVTAVTHHDINGMSAVSTVALKDVDVQMTSLTGYETYV